MYDIDREGGLEEPSVRPEVSSKELSNVCPVVEGVELDITIRECLRFVHETQRLTLSKTIVMNPENLAIRFQYGCCMPAWLQSLVEFVAPKAQRRAVMTRTGRMKRNVRVSIARVRRGKEMVGPAAAPN